MLAAVLVKLFADRQIAVEPDLVQYLLSRIDGSFVAAEAIVARDGRSVVFALRDGRAVEVPVTPGQKLGEQTAITGEVKSGERVVARPAPDLRSGALARAATK